MIVHQILICQPSVFNGIPVGESCRFFSLLAQHVCAALTQVRPDYQIAYVGSAPLSEEDAAAWEARTAEYMEECDALWARLLADVGRGAFARFRATFSNRAAYINA